MKKISLSFRTSSKYLNINHNNRELPEEKKHDKDHENIDWEKANENITLVRKPIEKVYEELFSEEVKKYNAKQTRKDRIVENYFSDCQENKSMDTQREFIVQFGDQKVIEETPKAREAFARQLVNYEKWFEKKYPDLRVFNAVIHMDETTPHLHFDLVPSATGYKKGVKKKPSFSKWLKNNNLDFKEFCDEQRAELEVLLKQLGAERKLVGTHKYLKPAQYREVMKKADTVLEKAKEEAETITKEKTGWEKFKQTTVNGFKAITENEFWNYIPEKIKTPFGKETEFLKVSSSMWHGLKITVKNLFKENAELKDTNTNLKKQLSSKKNLIEQSHLASEQQLKLIKEKAELEKKLKLEHAKSNVNQVAWNLLQQDNPKYLDIEKKYISRASKKLQTQNGQANTLSR